jgi:hypothetical protein
MLHSPAAAHACVISCVCALPCATRQLVGISAACQVGLYCDLLPALCLLWRKMRKLCRVAWHVAAFVACACICQEGLVPCCQFEPFLAVSALHAWRFFRRARASTMCMCCCLVVF